MTITSVHDGSSDKFYRAWADSADGSKGFSTTDSTKEYFGVYAGTTPPANYKAYSWTKIKGEAGRSVVDTEMEYAINDSKTIPPTSGWSLEMPVWKTGLYIWQRVKVSYSTGNPSYTTPHCLESNIIEDVTGNIGDWIFRDKTEVLSGTEIFTDKADEEALVHVEVDGKSWQEPSVGLTNLIQNGDFREGYNGWSLVGNPQIFNGRAHLKRLAGEPLVSISYQDRTIFDNKDDIYYFAAQGEIVTFNSGTGGIMVNDSQSGLQIWTLANQPTGIVSRNSSVRSLSSNLSPYIYANTNGNGVEYYIDYVMVINLTKEFGAGNEPTKEQMDAIIELNGYFEGKKILRTGDILLPKVNAPTPDYPIEIHSLNDFDVVSSVGKRNLILNSKDLGIHARTGTDEKLDEFLGVKNVIKITNPTSGMYINTPQIMSESTILGESYTLSVLFTYRGNKGSMPRLYLGPGSYITAKGDIEEGKFTRIYITSENVKMDITRIHMHMDGFDEVYLADWKIEKGTANTPYSPASEDILESDNYQLIDKINLLLDEPLRSVGDVKDRLFRDTDGLWKVERNVSERRYIDNTINVATPSPTGGVNSYHFGGSVAFIIGGGSQISVAGTNTKYVISSHFKATSNNNFNNPSAAQNEVGTIMQLNTETSRLFVRVPESLIGAVEGDSVALLVSKFRNWANINKPYFYYRLLTPTIEILNQELQDKLNNLRSFKDSNYIYTLLPDKSNILSENLKPTLHATFKSIAWANDFRYKFEQSKAMHATDIWFAKGVSNTIAPNIGWSTDAPVWEDGLYIWSKTITTYGDGRTEETSPVCITGATGRSVDKIEEWYYLSNKPDVLEGGTWSKTPPTWKDGKYIWTKNKIIYKNPSGSEETSPINTTGGSGQKGETGTDARTVRLANIIHAVHFDQDGLMPSVSSIAFPTAVQGFSGVTPYYEFKMGDTIVRGLSTASSWTLNTSGMKYSDFPLTVTVNVVISGQTLATDTVTIVGTKPGEDAYTVVLANESHTFVGDVSNAKAGSTTANVIAYRGGTQVGATIGAISGLPVGMSSTIYSNGTTSARVTFTVTTSMTSPNGVVNIPVTVNGKTFTKVFNYAIAFKGAKGDKGTDGIAGKDGVGIKATVLAYASSTSGTTTPTSGWQTTVPTVSPGNYLWTRTTWTYTDNSVENGYTVSRIGKDGNTGKDGVAGKDGVGIKSTVIHYGKTTSGTSHSGATWTTAIPSVPNGQFLWTRTTWTYDDNTTETGYSVAKMGETGATGPQGVSITKVDVQYYLSTSNTSLTGGSWSTTAPDWVNGRFMWSKTVTTYTSGSPTESKPVCITGAKGSTGSTGSTGATGRGVSSIVEQFYLSNSKTTQTGGSWSTTMPTWSPGKYVWTRSLITYTTGTPATSTTEPLVSSEWEAINEIEVGGRNLIHQTKSFSGWTTFNSAASRSDISGGIRLTWNLVAQSAIQNDLTQTLINGQEYVLKLKARGTLNNFQVFILSNPGPNLLFFSSASILSATEFKEITIPFKYTHPNTSQKIFIGGTSNAVGQWLEIENESVILEKGNKSTNWSPAPEDIEAAYTAVAQAKAEAERIKAESYADGKVTAEEQARIADAEAKLTAAKQHAENINKVQDIGNGDKKFINVGSLGTKPSSATGYLVIKTPLTFPYMTKMKISGYNYLTSKTNIDISVSFYAYTSNSFYNYSFISNGNYSYSKVQLARDSSGKTVVIIGNQSDAYSYPKISIDEVLVTYGTPPDSFKNGFSAEIVTDISMYTNVVNIPGDDTKLNISAAQTAANNAQSTANTASNSASTANSLLADIASDSKLTPTEKKAAKKEWDIIVGEKPKIDSSADTYGITTQKAAYNTAYSALNTYLSSLLSNLNTTSNIVGSTFRANFKAYYDARQDLLNAISASAKTLVNNIEIGGTNLVDGSPPEWQSKTFAVGTWMLDLTSPIPISSMGLKAGDTITLSIELEAGSRQFATRIEFFKTDSERNSIVGNSIKNGTGVSSLTATIPADRPYIIIRLQPDVAPVVTAYTIKYRRYKLEKGNKATDWSMSKNDYIKHVQDAQTDGQNYFHKSTQLIALTNMIQLGRDENTAPNGFTATGASTGPRSFRLGNVINSNGWWTVSGWFRGSQSVNIHFQMDINDGPQSKAFYTGTNNEWQYFEYTAYVSNYSSTHNFIDFNVSDWAYYFFKDVMVNKGDKAISWRPAPEDVQSNIDGKADNAATESALNEAAAKLQVLQQEVEAAATSNELKDFIDKYNKDMASRDKDARESERSLSNALASISSIQTNMGDMSQTWQFIDRFIKNTPQGIVVGNDSSGSYILIKEDRLAFYSNGQEVAFISQNLMEISRGAFVEQIQIAKYQFEESTTNHLTIRYVG